MTEVAIVQADAEGRIRAWSEGAEALLGHSAAAVIGRTLDVIVPEDLRDAHWKGFHAAHSRGSLLGNEPFVLPILCADGHVRNFAGRLILLRDAYERSVGAIAIFVTPRNT